ncbi:MAG: hypothetical protein H0V40_04720 [Actinobacteria bacterium]|nr:hypothetical protein [Actinomycetota bacterium]
MAIYSLLFGSVAWPESGRPAPRERSASSPARTERLSLRVPDGLRRRVEASARLEGLPSETWIVHALARSVDPRLDTP